MGNPELEQSEPVSQLKKNEPGDSRPQNCMDIAHDSQPTGVSMLQCRLGHCRKGLSIGLSHSGLFMQNQ